MAAEPTSTDLSMEPRTPEKEETGEEEATKEDPEDEEAEEEPTSMPPPRRVPMDPWMINLSSGSARHASIGI